MLFRISFVMLFCALYFGPARATADDRCESVLLSSLPSWSEVERRAEDPVVVAALANLLANQYRHDLNASILKQLSPIELRSIAATPRLAADLAAGWRDPFDDDREPSAEVQRAIAARIAFAARVAVSHLDYPSVTMAPALTESVFLGQAGVAGVRTERISVAYRFDQRPPAEIARAGGFFPHPNKRERGLSLLEHSLEGTDGGFFVSTTLDPENPNILPQPMFAARKYSEVEAVRILRGVNIPGAEVHRVLELRVAFEYQIENILGVRTGEHGPAGEAEFITNAVTTSQIKAFRRVVYVKYLPTSAVAQAVIRANELRAWAQANGHVGNLGDGFSLYDEVKRTVFGEWETI